MASRAFDFHAFVNINAALLPTRRATDDGFAVAYLRPFQFLVCERDWYAQVIHLTGFETDLVGRTGQIHAGKITSLNREWEKFVADMVFRCIPTP